MEASISDVFAKLRYGAASDWSTAFKPAECELMLAALDDEFVSAIERQRDQAMDQTDRALVVVARLREALEVAHAAMCAHGDLHEACARVRDLLASPPSLPAQTAETLPECVRGLPTLAETGQRNVYLDELRPLAMTAEQQTAIEVLDRVLAEPCYCEGKPFAAAAKEPSEPARWDEGPCYICAENVAPSEGWHREETDGTRRHWCPAHQPVWSRA
ncbi:MAG TPA: hypothetical protein VHD91_12600 [Gaiellaceae bacterium]|nr:hypothetical protein [Gaiellaceae bacterium]